MVVDRDHRHQAVERERAGVVGDHQRAALGRDVLGAAHLDAEPLLRDRAQRGQEEPLGDLGVEAVLVDGVVAGQPAAQEGQEPGELRLPLVAEDLAGGVLEGRQPVAGRDPGERTASAVVAAARRARAARAGRARASVAGRSAAGSGRGPRRPGVPGLRRRRACSRRAGARPGGRAGREAARRPTDGCRAGAAARAAAGADRDDLGVTHGRLRSGSGRPGGVGTGARGRTRRGPARSATGRRQGGPKSANASAVVNWRLEAEHRAHPGRCPPRDRR